MSETQGDRAAMICEPLTEKEFPDPNEPPIPVDRYDLTCIINNVSLAKQAALQGDTEELMYRLDGALSWYRSIFGGDHPFMGEKGRDEPAILLSLKGTWHRRRTTRIPSDQSETQQLP